MKCIIKILSILLMANILYANDGDYEYKIALLLLDGKDSTTKTIALPSCPYERCLENAPESISITTNDYPNIMKYLNIAIAKGNAEAPLLAFNTLYKQLDYKSKIPDDFLVSLLLKNFKMKKDEYYTNIKNYLQKMSDLNVCQGDYYLYSSFRYGYFGFNVDKEKEDTYKNKIADSCKGNSYFLMLSGL